MVCNVFQHFFATFMDQIQRPQFSVAMIKPQNCLVIDKRQYVVQFFVIN